MEPQTSKNKAIKFIASFIGYLLLAVLLVFTVLFVYYLWQFKFGDSNKLAQFKEEFKPKFTSIANNVELKKTINTEAKDYIHSNSPTKGKTDSPVTILAFIDFQCPFCKENYEQFKSIMTKYEPVAHIVIKHLPFENMHPDSVNAANASMCANEQNKFWEYYDLLFKQDNLGKENLIYLAEQIGVDKNQFEKCLELEKYKKDIEKDMLDAVDLELRGTPTYIINKDIIEGVVNLEKWDETVLKNIK